MANMSKKSKRKVFKKLIRVMDKRDGAYGMLGHTIRMLHLELPLMAHFGVIDIVEPTGETSEK